MASRLKPEFGSERSVRSGQKGIQQIQVLPQVGKACILCNGTLSFYVLPELSPAFGGAAKLHKCTWVGGVDLNNQHDAEDATILISVENRIRLVRIGEKPKQIRAFEVPGCLNFARRGNIACVADTSSYALLDVEAQQKIPLFDISALPSPSSPRNANSNDPGVASENGFASSASVAPNQNAQIDADDQANFGSDGATDNGAENVPSNSVANAENQPPKEAEHSPPNSVRHTEASLRPHLVSPTQDEFLLTTGTTSSEPGVGIFINLDGDVSRGTLEFGRYPEALAIDANPGRSDKTSSPDITSRESFVFAVVGDPRIAGSKVLEVQRYDVAPGENSSRFWVDVPSKPETLRNQTTSTIANHVLGISTSKSACHLVLSNVVATLSLKPTDLGVLHGTMGATNSTNATQDRERKEIEFVTSLSMVNARTIVWNAGSVWMAVRSPAMLRLDAELNTALNSTARKGSDYIRGNVLEGVLEKIHGSDPQNELEFLSLSYLRQKLSLLFIFDLTIAALRHGAISENSKKLATEVLIDGEIDPRLILTCIPILRNEVVYSQDGLWVQGGLKECLEEFLEHKDLKNFPNEDAFALEPILPVVKGYLMFWRRKKGFGSVADGAEKFASVDAALLHLLLILDSKSPRGPGKKGSIRAELGGLVDGGLDCPDRAIELLTEFKRPYVLSRLYHSRRQFDNVLSTWRKIVDGEPDEGGEFEDGERKIRKYLGERKSQSIVEDFGTWLAKRNPKLGVRVFADPKAQVQFKPEQVLELLQRKAPNAVKVFLEHLVFDYNRSEYASILVGSYLDSVLQEIEASKESRKSLIDSYEAYRALNPPKPSYSQFAANISIDADWWRSRLRLLQLLGGRHDAASQYDLSGILSRVEPYKKELVPETIILSGRQGRHRDAIQLLTHGLGDFDTAIRYCILGGSSTYSTPSRKDTSEKGPSQADQTALFECLLEEFLRIPDSNVQMDQTSELLERFTGWFNFSNVLTMIPETWSVQRIYGFLESGLRRVVVDRNESTMTRALITSDNMVVNSQYVEKVTALGAVTENTKSP